MKIKLFNFFNIENSEIELSPIMIFCGDNGSGKTHLVKILTTINEFFLSREIPDLTLSELEKFNYIFNMQTMNNGLNMYWKKGNLDDEFDEEVLFIEEESKSIGDLEFKFNIDGENLVEFYDDIELKMNELLNGSLPKILKKAYSDDEYINKLSDVKLEILHKEPLEIHFFIRGTSDFECTIEVRSRNLVSRFGLSILGGFSEDEPEIADYYIEESTRYAMQIIMKHIYEINLFPSHIATNRKKGMDYAEKFYYLPASREAYQRDLALFASKKENNKLMVSRYLVDEDGNKSNNLNSIDPFIEKYVDEILRLIAIKSNKKLDSKTKLFVEYLQNIFLKAEIISSPEGDIKYRLPDNSLISANMASSLQNEYAILKILIEKVLNPNIILEEPESHLSISNSVKLIQYLLAFQEHSSNLLWLTTHNNFIGDALNNIIMISKLDKERQNIYLEKLNLNNLIEEFNGNFISKINAYLINGNKIQILPKTSYGVDFDIFNKQINDFLDITTELQWELENN
ncbi:hypothetical protein ACIQZG_01210 [Lysinibacillus sp. NPDC096418]|uniref:hypothetical protein n=1 Tax=Lysinibacillus sp. NPDC096418 TaxID=3364138 RepID=UPI0037F50D27